MIDDLKRQEVQILWHEINLQKMCAMLGTNLTMGLTDAQALKRNQIQGQNRLPQKQKVHPVLLFIKEITNWFAILLWVGSFLSIAIYIMSPDGNEANLCLSIALIIVILITGVITYLQSAKSQQIMQKFKQMLPSNCKVIRQGKIQYIEAYKLARGDLVQIQNGQKIPADLRIIQSNHMKVDNSSITGQTNLLLRTSDCTSKNILQTKNLAFFGTYCKQGRGRGIVIKISDNTYIGSVANLTLSQTKTQSPLKIELNKFVLMITFIAGFLGLLFVLLAKVVVGYSIFECMIFGIGIIVANVPQGILACVTISLAITAKKLASKNVLVKNLQSVQTLGSTSCICSDKTGTLTMNKMSVSRIWWSNRLQDFQNNKSISNQLYRDSKEFKLLIDASILSSWAKFVNQNNESIETTQIKKMKVIGDASETALLKFVQYFQPVQKIRNELYKRARDNSNQVFFHHFDSVNKYSFGIAKKYENKQRFNNCFCIFLKGAPEKIWKMSRKINIDGKNQLIDHQWDQRFTKINNQLGQAGQRVLGFAYRQLNTDKYPSDYIFNEDENNQNFQFDDFTFLGMISLIDPPKPTVYEAINKCRASGVKVVMITGDQSVTALAIAKKIGIITLKTNLDYQKQGFSRQEAIVKANAVSINGAMIEQAYKIGQQVGNQKMKGWLQKPQVIFSRTTPIHKLKIVENCQQLGHIVGVTGDGVNDAPAIKQANIGISMGISGSQVTKDAADMVLLDDDFSSIVAGIEEGRKVFDNLKKTIMYLLTSNATQIWPFLVMIILQIPLPISNIFMLCICVGTDIYPAIALAYEQPQLDVMTRKPRKLGDSLVSGRMLVHSYGLMGSIASAAGFFTYFTIMQLYGFSPRILLNLIAQQAVVPLNQDSQPDLNFNRVISYDQSADDLGNPYLPRSCVQATFSNRFPNWVKFTNSRYDLRMAYNKCCPAPSENSYCSMFDWPSDYLKTISPITNSQVAFTTEALLYAQSGYFASVVLVQWSNIFACKSRKMSFTYSGFNQQIFIGILLESVLMIILLYVPVVNRIFGGRPLELSLVGIPGLCFSMLLLMWQESRKFLMSSEMKLVNRKWFQRYVMW